MSGRSKLLMMIDNESLRTGLTLEFTKLRYQLSTPNENIIQKVFDEVPHLIIIDEDFNRGEGRKVALIIKEDLVLKYIPIILLVTDPEPSGREKNSPIDFFVKKKQDTQNLLLCVRKVLAENTNELDLNPLSRLPGNRSSVLCIERAIHSKKHFAVCYVDLSNLAAFNSAYGDARGDEVIIRLAEIIHEVLKRDGSNDDFLGHLGGDDFIVVTGAGLAEPLAEAIIKHFDEAIPNFYDAHDRKQGFILQRNKEGLLTRYPIMTVSIAIVHNDFRRLSGISEVSRVAGELKRYMKSLEGSCYMKDRRRTPRDFEGSEDIPLEVRFPSKMKSVKRTGKLRNTDEYRPVFNTILKSRKLQTFYQPIVELKTKKIAGYEALTSSPVDGPLRESTTLFEVARELGRTIELDQLCVELALRNGQALDPDKKLFLNLNHETLIDSKIMKNLFSEKGVIGFKNIVIEVTEQSILRSFEKVREALLELKEQGVSMAIDDVGGGAVSLRDVAILKPDYIKFDRSLIRQIDANPMKQQIVLSMILFANGIQAATTAEGIETKEEYETVLNCGIHLGQGYYFARPNKKMVEIS